MYRVKRLNQTVKVVNKKTGEIREAELTKIWTITDTDKDKFYMQYCNGVTAVLGLKPEICGYVYMWLCVNQDKNKIYIDSVTRDQIAKDCNTTKSSIFRALKALIENGIISKQSRGYYNLNPWYSWSGSRDDRAILLDKARVTVTINITPDEEIYKVES